MSSHIGATLLSASPMTYILLAVIQQVRTLAALAVYQLENMGACRKLASTRALMCVWRVLKEFVLSQST
eukprot:6455794-Amphidinium_carterae.1